MPTNDFLPFGTAVGANVMSQADYLSLVARSNGFASGTAASAQLNKAWRQSSIIASVLAQFIVDQSGLSAIDDGTTAALEANLLTAIRAAGRQSTILTDTGSANAYSAVNTPPLSTLPASGYSQRVNISNANSGASTYAPDGLPARPIYGLALQPLQGGELAQGIAVMMYLVQPGVNSGSGAWILIESLGGSSQIVAATKSRHAIAAGQVQSGAATFGFDTGTVNIYNVAYSPAIAGFSEGMLLTFKAGNANTGSSVLTLDGVTSYPLLGPGQAPLQGGEIVPQGEVSVRWNGSLGAGGSWVIVNSTGGSQQVTQATKSLHAVSAGQIQAQGLTAFTSAGTAPSFTLTPVPAITAYVAGQRFRVKFSTAGNGSDTLNVSGLGAKNLKQYDYTGSKVAPVTAANQLADVEYDGSEFVILDPLPVNYLIDPWALQPIGTYIALRDDLVGVTAPPTTSSYRYVVLSASSSYNTGVLSSESVTGTAPLVIATAVISLAGSPLNGRTINLINTERRSLRAGSSGTVEQDAFPSHGHTEFVGSPNVASSTTDTTTSFASGLSAAGAYSQRLPTSGTINNVVIGPPIPDSSGNAIRLSNETRVKSIGVTYYMRVK